MRPGWYEPPDEAVCEDGCVLEDEHDVPAGCMDADELREEAAIQRAEERADEAGGWKNLR